MILALTVGFVEHGMGEPFMGDLAAQDPCGGTEPEHDEDGIDVPEFACDLGFLDRSSVVQLSAVSVGHHCFVFGGL